MNTFYHGDCLFVMNHDISPDSIDLIYLDPPFFTGKVQKGTAKWQPGAMEVSYDDSKRFWKDKGLASHAPEWLKHIALTRPDFASYLFYMMERLQACHEALKDTGSIYLHCDEKASHYLKMIMDEVFGFQNYQNEIIWNYGLGGSTPRRWASKHDDILFYSKTNKWTFTPIMIPATSQMLKGQLKKEDDVWEIPSLNNMAKERVGYPTQKPLVLLERIIKASSNEGDTILDPFCGCGTAIIAAQRLNRNWVGIDISKDAYEISSNRQGELPLEFIHFEYISRDLNEVLTLNPQEFEKWVNGFYKAHKPMPDKGVDGITPDGVPIQTKSYLIKYPIVSEFTTNIRHHPKVSQPVTRAIMVSQVGFDDGARQRQFEIETKEGIKIELLTPNIMLEVR